MTVTVQPLTSGRISALVCACSDYTSAELRIFDRFQALGEVYLGYVDTEFVCCWGLISPSFLSTRAYLWMWAPKHFRHHFVFIRQSQIHIRAMLRCYDEIVGECLATNRSAQRWLRWLGATFDEPRGPVLPFTIRRPHG